jgi:hypothetical protein
MGDMASACYRFTLMRDDVELLSGRAIVLLEVAE